MTAPVVIQVSDSKDSAGVEVALPIDESRLRQLSAYLENDLRIGEAKIFKSGFPVVKRVSYDREHGFSIVVTEVNYGEVCELLHVCRPVFLAREPATFEKVLGFFGKHGEDTPLAIWTKRVRLMYEQGDYQPYFQLSISNTPLFHEKSLSTWLNGVEYHQDAEKARLVQQLEEELGQEVVRGVFVAQLSGRLKAIGRLANVVQLVVDKAQGKAPLGGAI